MLSSPWPFRPRSVFLFAWLLSLVSLIAAYDVPINDKDYSRQVCSGMWGGPNAYINVTFDAKAQGSIAMVIYEWKDVQYLGKATSSASDEDLPKTYICTTSALSAGYCGQDQLGQFILDLPKGKNETDTTFWSARVELSPGAGIRDLAPARRWPPTVVGPDHVLKYTAPIHYPVHNTGFYCVAAIPVTVESLAERAADAVPYHPKYKGVVHFENTFKGQLSASDYPKVNFHFIMFVAYSAFAAYWAWTCYQHMQDLLPMQYYLSGLVALLVLEMFATWGYYRYLNAHGKSTAATAFLIVVAILDAGRNSMSFFLLLVVALGLSVVRESLGRTMIKCQLLAGAHFLFGILYAIGIVELELESTAALVLMLFIIPLAFTLSGFMLWIMYALHATVAHLRARKQRFKLKMFERLHMVLMFDVAVIAVFFVVTTMSFSGRMQEDYAARSWKLRWWLLDGWLALLYFFSFALIAFLWRPTMSDEIAQDEEDAEDYDLEAIQDRGQHRQLQDDDDDDAATLVGGRQGHNPHAVGEDQVVFEIGDEDDEDDDAPKRKPTARLSGERPNGTESERRGLMH